MLTGKSNIDAPSSSPPPNHASIDEPNCVPDSQIEDRLCQPLLEQGKADLDVWTGDREFAIRDLERKTHQEFTLLAPRLSTEIERDESPASVLLCKRHY